MADRKISEIDPSIEPASGGPEAWDEEYRLAKEARRDYDGEVGLARLESSLGLREMGNDSERIEALVAEVGRRVSAWEQLPAKALLQENELISGLFKVTDTANVSSHVNNGHLPNLWWARLVLALSRAGLYDRLMIQIHRETAAQSAQLAAENMRDSSSGPKLVGPDNDGDMLAMARFAADEASTEIDELERLDNAGLMANSKKILAWHEALVESFTVGAPPGHPHEAQVISYNEWLRHGFSEFINQWKKIVDSMPAGGFARLLDLVSRVNHGEAAARYISDSTTASANARWARLDPVKEWAFQQRLDDPSPRSRAAVIKRILPEIKDRAKAADEPLTGDDIAVTRTVTGWFRKANIR